MIDDVKTRIKGTGACLQDSYARRGETPLKLQPFLKRLFNGRGAGHLYPFFIPEKRARKEISVLRGAIESNCVALMNGETRHVMRCCLLKDRSAIGSRPCFVSVSRMAADLLQVVHAHAFSSSDDAAAQELDFLNEANNQIRMKEVLNGMRGQVFVPDVLLELSTRRVLVSEWVDGVKLIKAQPAEV